MPHSWWVLSCPTGIEHGPLAVKSRNSPQPSLYFCFFIPHLVYLLQESLKLMVTVRTWVRSLGWEDPLEKGKATHSSILARRIPWTVYSPWAHKELDMTERLLLHFHFHGSCTQGPGTSFIHLWAESPVYLALAVDLVKCPVNWLQLLLAMVQEPLVSTDLDNHPWRRAHLWKSAFLEEKF